jgi:hypothetical protein
VTDDRVEDRGDHGFMVRFPQLGRRQIRNTLVPGGGDVGAAVGVLMGVEAASLAVMSALHLGGVLRGGSAPFRPGAAGLAELLIGLVLLAAILTLHYAPHRARPIALAALGFAILGFLVGLNFTVRSANTIDIAYHATVLPLLILTLALLLRRRHPEPAMPHSPLPTN